MIQRSLSFSQMSVIDYGANNPNELGEFSLFLFLATISVYNTAAKREVPS